jgi:hypothetical protein
MSREIVDAALAEEPAYHGELGSFIEAYAHFEMATQLYITSLAEIDERLVLTFCSGANLETKVTFIRKIWRFRPPTAAVKAELEEVFRHAEWISKVRNFMLHYGSSVTDRGRITSDYSRALVKVT